MSNLSFYVLGIRFKVKGSRDKAKVPGFINE